MKTAIIIILTILIIASLLAMLYIILYSKIQFSKIRTLEAEEVIIDELKNRSELILKCKETIEKNTKKELTLFSDIENIMKTNINSYDLERKISESIATIYLIKNDYPKIEEKKDFKEVIRKLNESDTRINAAKSYYNKNNEKLVKQLKSFPSNIIGMIHRIKIKPYYKVREIFNESDDGIKI